MQLTTTVLRMQNKFILHILFYYTTLHNLHYFGESEELLFPLSWVTVKSTGSCMSHTVLYMLSSLFCM